jgi:TonB family protein
VRAHLRAFHDCYDVAHVRAPGLAGRSVLAFTIASDGTVTSAHARGLGDATLERCLERAARGMRFAPAGPGTVEVSYPFTFGGQASHAVRTAATPAPTMLRGPRARPGSPPRGDSTLRNREVGRRSA